MPKICMNQFQTNTEKRKFLDVLESKYYNMRVAARRGRESLARSGNKFENNKSLQEKEIRNLAEQIQVAAYRVND